MEHKEFTYTAQFTFKVRGYELDPAMEGEGPQVVTAAQEAEDQFSEMCGEFADVIESAKLFCHVGKET